VDLLQRFGAGLRQARKSRGLTQEDFSLVSSRTYLSSLERGIKCPTIAKVEELATVIGVHPLVLFALAYLPAEHAEIESLCSLIKEELTSVNLNSDFI
jgi:transcriptional regulator with XRE-family HTH domain